jgi:hypothetical protein
LLLTCARAPAANADRAQAAKIPLSSILLIDLGIIVTSPYGMLAAVETVSRAVVSGSV